MFINLFIKNIKILKYMKQNQFKKGIKVTLFKNIYDTSKGFDYDIDEILDSIKVGKWKSEVEILRQCKNESDKKTRKLNMPNFTATGTFTERNNNSLEMPSGLISIDFDDIPIDELQAFKTIICNDKFSFASFISVSGNGLCVLVKIDFNRFNDSFLGLQSYYFNQYAMIIDPACKDLSRSRIVSYDPELYENVNSNEFKDYFKVNKKHVEQQSECLHWDDNFTKLLFSISSDICSNYQEWFRCGMAIANQYGDSGLEYFQHISKFRNSSKANFADQILKQYQYCLSSNDKSISIGTFYYLIKKAGYKIIDEKSNRIAKSAYYYKINGTCQQDALNLMKEKSGFDQHEIEPIISAVYNINVDDSKTFEGAQIGKSIVDEVLSWCQVNYNFKRNEITKFIENDGKVLEEEDLNTIYIQAKRIFPKLNYNDLFRIIDSSYTLQYNPIKEFIEGIQFEGSGHIEKVVKSLTTNTGTLEWRIRMYTRWLVGIIESIYGGKSVLMLVLSGKQNVGKSEHFLRLLPQELQKYFAPSQLDAGKDSYLLMTQKLLIFDDEFAGKSKQDSKHMKFMLSSASFSLRAPYGKMNKDYRRLAVLCGTSNDEEILNDPTGNRRIIIFDLNGECDFALYNSVDKSQLLAEAYNLWKSGYTSKICPEDQKLLNQYTFDHHYETTIEAELIQKYLIPSSKESNGVFMMSLELQNHILIKSEQKIYPKRFGQELKRLDFKRVMNSELKRYGYYVKFVETDFIPNDFI